MISCNEERFFGKTDNETIQNAVNYADEIGESDIIIPHMNARTGQMVWNIEDNIYLKSNQTIRLESAYLKAADDKAIHVFCNEVSDEEARDIYIIGSGNATIDGGKWTYENRPEYYFETDPNNFPDGSDYDLIFLYNVCNFAIKNVCITNAKHYSICLTFCRFGTVSDIFFRNYATVENQDGVDLRYGCEYITVENIFGVTGDDTVALNALDEAETTRPRVKNKTIDIHDISIRNIIASTHGCSLVRLLNVDGAKLYNITIENIKDTGKTVSICAIFFGTPGAVWARNRQHTEDEFYNITIRDVTTSAPLGIRFAESCRDVLVENIHTYGTCQIPFEFSKPFTCHNFTLRNAYLRSDKPFDAVFRNMSVEEARINFKISDVYAGPSKYLFVGDELDIENFVYESPSEGYLIDSYRVPQLSLYGRYHKHSLGKVIEERTKDNRFGGTTPPEADF